MSGWQRPCIIAFRVAAMWQKNAGFYVTFYVHR